MNAVDPSGYFSKWVKKKIKKITRSVIKGLSKVFGPELVNIVGNFVTGYFGGPAGVAAWNYEFARAMGASSGDALKSGAIAGVAAFAFNAIGAKFNGAEGTWNATGGASHIAAHAMTGGVISELQGGKFGHGFISAGFTKFATSNMNVIQGKSAASVAGRTTVAALIGGTASKLTGGKFANGAQTAAMAHLFNAEGVSRLELRNRPVSSITKDIDRGVYDGVKSVFEGVGRAFRYVGRSIGLYGDAEFDNANMEGHVMDTAISKAVSFAVDNPSAAAQGSADAGRAVYNLAKSSANAYTVSRTASRVVTGVLLAPLGGLATVGDVTYGIEQGRVTFEEQVEHVFYGNQ
ncbi:MAG: hypothetical protein ACR2PX_08770 [Endozoicomonas sp.]|uniref:hypothetical protein n=1 Tax=Endozoicomonas sp. TaxID=1892382 RepID=UPI003D9B75D1